jgi:TRAF3-interacting protein 1
MGDYWKPTAEMFSSLFEKPKMAEKLLVKPPFKYLYDIIAECTKVTGFGKGTFTIKVGLYTGEELTQEYYETKERKMAYLQKIIDLVELMSKQPVEAKPGKIVAGLEPELTNILLQSIFKVATSGAPSEPFVKKILSGGKGEEKPKEKPKEP